MKLVLPLLFKSLLNLAYLESLLRLKYLRQCLASDNAKDLKIAFLEDLTREQHNELETQRVLLCHQQRSHYSLKQRLYVMRFMEQYQIPRSKITERFGIARSTFYRWLHGVEDTPSNSTSPSNKTPLEMVKLIWKIIEANPAWGRHKVAMQTWLLKVFVSPSTVRNILKAPYPRNFKSHAPAVESQSNKHRFISAFYPNHVWSADITTIFRWGFWPTHVFVVIDHFSRKILNVQPLEGPNTGWVVCALEKAFQQFGVPKHLITDQGAVFKSTSFAEFLKQHKVKHRFGAVGKHGSIAVTERVIETLKYEWVRRVPLIQGFEHLRKICDEFCLWYNEWRPHSFLDGATPDSAFRQQTWKKPPKDAKTIPKQIKIQNFPETRTTAFRFAA